MPHCVVELSQNLLAHKKTLLGIVRDATFSSTLFSEEDIKVRMLTYDEFLVGTTNDAFVHVTASILSGRTDAQKKKLSLGLANAIARYFSDKKGISVTVSIVDMHRDSYQKIRLN